MTTPTLSDLLDVAVRAAETAGRHAMQNKHRRTIANQTFAHDVKLVLDVECQEIAEGVIAEVFPDHAILGEEHAAPNNASDYEWIIDPIDGTMNYTHGFPYWCCSVAVRRGGNTLAGCVVAPEFGQCYTAHRDSEPCLNGQPIRVGQTQRLKDSIIFTGLSKHLESDRKTHFELFQTLALHTQKIRINGAAALDLCHVAAGTSDGFVETSLYVWDHAAAGLIAERAGAVLAIKPGKSPHECSVICANEHLIGDLRSIYSKYT